MKITWDWSLESEVNRIVQSARNIGNGFYTLQHFYPLAYSSNQKYDNVGVYLPDLSYSQVAHFWQKVARLDDHHLPLAVPHNISESLLPLLTHLDLGHPDTTTLQAQFANLYPKIASFLLSTFPDIQSPSQITVYPTYFGTTGSFNWMTEHGEIVIYHRLDQGLRSLIECVLTSIIRPKAVESYHTTWSESEFLIDYLINNSVLSSLIPQETSYQSTLDITRSSHPKLAKLSQEFLQKIDAPIISDHSFTSKNNQILFGNQPLSTLTSRELKIMQSLLGKSPSPVTLDEIGDLIFTQEDKFSLAAINQVISRLRAKLDALGISSSYLATASGTGYYLKN